ncbi:MAG: Uma2 family endonuclease [Thermomicrobiales bacterium]
MALARPAGTWKYADLLDLPDDGTRYEIIDGELYELPAPLFAHVAAVIALLDLLLPLVQRLGGKRYTAPVDVVFPGVDPVEPDIVVLLPGSLARPVRRGIEGPPDLLIEVLSPSNRSHDTVRKRDIYARGGVREYWIVDPEAASVEIIGSDGETVQRVTAAAGDTILTLRSPLLGEFTADAAEMFPGYEED